MQKGISTSTNLHLAAPGNPFCFSMADCAAALREAGFTHADVTFPPYCVPGTDMAGPDWRRWVDAVGEAFAAQGLPINQTHTHFYLHKGDAETLAFQAEMVDRCLQASATLGAPWTVMHILRVIDLDTRDPEIAMEANRAYFEPYGDKARRYGIRIAIENGLTGLYHTADDLLELNRRLADDAFGICWDTGHANIVCPDQGPEIRKLGKKLVALHINDNHGEKDEHLLPFFGTVDFSVVMASLRAIDFGGVLTLESGGSTRPLPPVLRPEALRLAAKMGQALEGL